jgi:hypothetical protein
MLDSFEINGLAKVEPDSSHPYPHKMCIGKFSLPPVGGSGISGACAAGFAHKTLSYRKMIKFCAAEVFCYISST